jgi:Domain of unknown function (DUF1707)/Cell wall-active antibiotics response 4TMS YvqF
MDPHGLSDNSRLRASDADRDRAASVLSTAMAEGRLTAEEHSDRLDAIYAAKTQAELVPLLDDLPGHAVAPAPGPAGALSRPAGEPQDRIVAILGGATRKGTWHPSPLTTIVTIMGGAEIDLRDAVLPGSEITINTLCIMGGVEITVPPEMRVVDSGTSIMGGHDHDGDTAESLQPGAPVLRITGLCVMGGVEIKHKARKPPKSRRNAIGG